jgi:hypothetical protein
MVDSGKTEDQRGDWDTLPDVGAEPGALSRRPDVIEEEAGREWVVNSPKKPDSGENGENTT